jgi:menaquinone-dependent protoporphyrinogen oxidase
MVLRTRPGTVEREEIQKSVLVAYASKHGTTMEIAERIAEDLREAGQDADARPVQAPGDLGDYKGFVVGSAAYMGRWWNDAAAFVRENQHLLTQRPVWLFSSGPLGTEMTDARVNQLLPSRK